MPSAASPLPRFCAAYIRVSTDDQAELSPETQLEEIRKYAQREGIILLQEQIYIDSGISGKKAERRPEFMRMIATAKEKDCPFSVILLWKYSRFARNQEESIFYKSILRSKCGVDVVSVTEPLIAGPFGSLIERIIEWMDEFYSIRLSQEVKRSMLVNAQRGKLQATPSFGYRVEDGRLIPVEEEAQLIRRIFDSFVAGKGLFPIAKELNDLGIRTHRGNRFENRTVEYILRNPVYIGKLRWNPAGRTRRDFFNENLIIADAEHEPLISLVRCSACGATLIFAKPHYYKCNNYARGRCTHSQHIRVDLLEAALLSKLEADAKTSEGLGYEITYTTPRGGSDLARLEAALRQIQTKKARLQEAYLSGVLELPDFAAAKKELDQGEARIRQELAEFHAKTDETAVRNVLQSAIGSALETLRRPDAPLEQKNTAARSIIENCVFDKAASVLSITYRVVF